MGLTMDNLEIMIEKAKQENARFIALTIEMDGFPEKEIIVNPTANFDSKLEYYKKTYDHDLNHKYSKGIRIFGFTYGDNLSELDGIVF